ncbi:hypothetical protein NEILACOT_04429 [Neisseria lactamica ATCC 23970]|uniref:Uncharacterized protein n=1 Tax=Neisseria lactamica ATCC 23970 TaxID=546265 RepID=D0WA60_NEILA|nr:hypothetical protein NEILACOT_04429 [Neisseria lactamica ATCC 23970]
MGGRRASRYFKPYINLLNYSGLTKTSTALPRLGSKRTIL